MTMNNISTIGGLPYKGIELSRLKFQQSSANFKNTFHDKLKKKLVTIHCKINISLKIIKIQITASDYKL